ncbi:hypothetical protein [Phyllobacterium sp. OV277]|uniref:hypothetical protein n=1 Tax=Phyllobacterium sp. OV277 TaxID=1882772 RepID=UPI00088E78CD|nr:hypothetical protein [Phyllobacterium sp. OV277]SDP08586.1 hypothetical protein SAMN05443582_103362 [Phyllobacterium sp. OV277]
MADKNTPAAEQVGNFDNGTDERALEVLIVRGYFREEGKQIDPGTVIELPLSEAKAAIKNGIATFPDEA